MFDAHKTHDVLPIDNSDDWSMSRTSDVSANMIFPVSSQNEPFTTETDEFTEKHILVSIDEAMEKPLDSETAIGEV